MGVWGHPCGGMFSSMCAFCPHVVSIILGSLEECGCELCVAVTSDAEASEGGGGEGDVKGQGGVRKLLLKQKRHDENREQRGS